MILTKIKSCTRYATEDKAALYARLLTNDAEGAEEYVVEKRGSGWFIVAYENGEEIGIL